MFFIFNKKVYEYDRLFTFLSCIAGFIFFLGQVYHITANFDFEVLFSTFQKITFQSNMFAFIISTIYFLNPKHPIFSNNTAMLLAVIILLFAGIGFWVLLFPVYFVDLTDYLVYRENLDSYAFSFFFLIWNHAITQIFFLIMFYFAIKKCSNNFLIPTDKKIINSYLLRYMLFWSFTNIISSFLDLTFPVYGIMTNFNWNTRWSSLNNISVLFDFRILFFSHVICFCILILLGNYLYSITKYFYAINSYNATKNN